MYTIRVYPCQARRQPCAHLRNLRPSATAYGSSSPGLHNAGTATAACSPGYLWSQPNPASCRNIKRGATWRPSIVRRVGWDEIREPWPFLSSFATTGIRCRADRSRTRKASGPNRSERESGEETARVRVAFRWKRSFTARKKQPAGCLLGVDTRRASTAGTSLTPHAVSLSRRRR